MIRPAKLNCLCWGALGVLACENAQLSFNGQESRTYSLHEAGAEGGATQNPHGEPSGSTSPLPDASDAFSSDDESLSEANDSTNTWGSNSEDDNTRPAPDAASLGVDVTDDSELGSGTDSEGVLGELEAGVSTPDSATQADVTEGTDASATGATSTAETDTAETDTSGATGVCDDCESSDPCLRATCDPETGTCELLPAGNVTCDDNNACTTNDRCDSSGECVGSRLDCSTLDDQCMEGTCNPDTGACVANPLPANTSCDDGNSCTQNDACDAKGTCLGAARDCSDLDSACADGVCDPATGACTAKPAVSGHTCDDENACTTGDECGADGRCVGAPVDCTSEDGTCTEGVCNSQTGRCEAVPADGRACDDEDECTALDACEDGVCRGASADTCSESAELNLSSGSASLTMSTRCAKNDFRLLQLIDDDTDCFSTYGPDVMILLDLSDFDEPVRLFATTNSATTDFDTVLVLTTAECSEDGMLMCDDDGGADLTSELEVIVEPDVYVLVVDGFHGGEKGQFRLDVEVAVD